MDAALKANLEKAVWLVTGFTALSVGLGTMGINVLEVAHMEGLREVLRYFVGVAGLASLVMFFSKCAKGKC